jgi:hypothetical protein
MTDTAPTTPAPERRRTETIERDGLPSYHVVVTWPENAWIQHNGKPGYAHFDVFNVISRLDSGALLFERKGATCPTDDMTENVNEAARVAEGDVKWDGCVNYTVGEFDTDNRLAVMLHACYPHDLDDLFQAVRRGYALAAEMVDALTLHHTG